MWGKFFEKKREKKAIKKIEAQKNERKREKGQCYYPFSTHVLQSRTMIFMIESHLFCHFHILVGIFHYRTWLVYSNDGLPQNALGLREQASWMHTHLVSLINFHIFIALVHPFHGNPYSLHWHQSVGISIAHWLVASMWDFLPFCLLTQPQSSYYVPPIVLCPWLALIYCVKVEKVWKD